MNERTRDWLDRARNARSAGNEPVAEWCEQQADWWLSNYENADRLRESIARLEAGHG